MSQKLKDRVAVVTGSSKGIGASIAKLMAEEGAAVVVNYATSKKDAERVVDEIVQKGGKAIAVQANVTQQSEVQHLFAESNRAFGQLDIVINNAGTYHFGPLKFFTSETFHEIFDLNVLGLILVTQEAAKLFGPSGGSIVNIGSIISSLALPNSVIYSASKSAVDAVTRCLSKELGPRKIRVNSVNPGMVETEGAKSGGLTGDEFRKKIEAQTPLGRTGLTQDIAPAVVFLASDDARWITGETLFIAGGLR